MSEQHIRESIVLINDFLKFYWNILIEEYTGLMPYLRRNISENNKKYIYNIYDQVIDLGKYIYTDPTSLTNFISQVIHIINSLDDSEKSKIIEKIQKIHQVDLDLLKKQNEFKYEFLINIFKLQMNMFKSFLMRNQQNNDDGNINVNNNVNNNKQKKKNTNLSEILLEENDFTPRYDRITVDSQHNEIPSGQTRRPFTPNSRIAPNTTSANSFDMYANDQNFNKQLFSDLAQLFSEFHSNDIANNSKKNKIMKIFNSIDYLVYDTFNALVKIYNNVSKYTPPLTERYNVSRTATSNNPMVTSEQKKNILINILELVNYYRDHIKSIQNESNKKSSQNDFIERVNTFVNNTQNKLKRIIVHGTRNNDLISQITANIHMYYNNIEKLNTFTTNKLLERRNSFTNNKSNKTLSRSNSFTNK